MARSDVVSFYRFFDLADPAALVPRLQKICDERGLLGTVLVATEGLNGTLAGRGEDILAVFTWLSDSLEFDTRLDGHWTRAAQPPFRRMRVREKKEIVTLGRPQIRPQAGTGRHVPPDEWNALLDNPDTRVIDTRNRYEVEVGSFRNAIDPQTDSFRDFVSFAEKLAAEDQAEDGRFEQPLAMFCTGGIRCEKATALMLELGYKNVNQLDGGILNYLETVDRDESLWEGECFVFDTRVAVDGDLAEGAYVQCHACRRPLSESDTRSPDYLEGVSCPKCVGELDADRAARLRERRKQVALARKRGEAHIGARLPVRGKS